MIIFKPISKCSSVVIVFVTICYCITFKWMHMLLRWEGLLFFTCWSRGDILWVTSEVLIASSPTHTILVALYSTLLEFSNSNPAYKGLINSLRGFNLWDWFNILYYPVWRASYRFMYIKTMELKTTNCSSGHSGWIVSSMTTWIQH